ncbi:MAG: helix-turn-helix domain-containing protein [Bacteroidota bacterium]
MVNNFEFIKPNQHVLDYVKYFWILEGTASEEVPYRHSTIPDGTGQLLFFIKGSIEGQNTVYYGPSIESGEYILSEDFCIFGVCFYPFSIPFLCCTSAEKLLNKALSLNEIKPLGETVVVDKILTAERHQERSHYFEDVIAKLIMQRKAKPSQIFAKIRHMLTSNDDTMLVNPTRQLQRLMKRHTGFTPKQFSKILRLQNAIDEKQARNLTELAGLSGYYDQSHFSNDFKQLTGKTPKEYFVKRHPSLDWRAIGKEVAFFQL